MTKGLSGVITTFFKKGFDRKQKMEPRLSLMSLSTNPLRRDQPAQRLRLNGCGSTVAVEFKPPGHENGSNRPELLFKIFK
ncbi:MAG TPA: hypothetical protein VN414_00305 [Methanosarcina sp.]|nr:hypothetical protein [Methanosarcina sp.]